MTYGNKIIKDSVLGIFFDQDAFYRTLNILKSQNFQNSDISILMRSGQETVFVTLEETNKSPEIATTGAATGALAGGIFGWLVSAGLLSIPGLGAFITAGPFMAAIAGASIGSTLGGITGGLIGLGIPEVEALKYENFVKEGAILISVHIDNDKWKTRAKEILEENGATNIYTTSLQSSELSTSNKNLEIDQEFNKEFDMRRTYPHA
ncbi:MAG: hypothetical protein Q7U04_07865 [Bacteriovorax sp.]|nr:hypothetical protein [Bacteriovorax sp.]